MGENIVSFSPDHMVIKVGDEADIHLTKKTKTGFKPNKLFN